MCLSWHFVLHHVIMFFIGSILVEALGSKKLRSVVKVIKLKLQRWFCRFKLCAMHVL